MSARGGSHLFFWRRVTFMAGDSVLFALQRRRLVVAHLLDRGVCPHHVHLLHRIHRPPDTRTAIWESPRLLCLLRRIHWDCAESLQFNDRRRNYGRDDWGNGFSSLSDWVVAVFEVTARNARGGCAVARSWCVCNFERGPERIHAGVQWAATSAQLPLRQYFVKSIYCLGRPRCGRCSISSRATRASAICQTRCVR